MVGNQPSLRADARRNREKILSVALQHFSAKGIDTSLEEIAKAAGVGSGTLYRHFPTRDALLAAALRNAQEDLFVGAEAARGVDDPGAALRAWLNYLRDYLRTFNGLPAPVLAAIKEQASPLAVPCQTLLSITEEFLTRAQKAKHARVSTTPRDLLLAALALAWVADHIDAVGSTEDALDAILAHGYLSTPGAPSTDPQ